MKGTLCVACNRSYFGGEPCPSCGGRDDESGRAVTDRQSFILGYVAAASIAHKEARGREPFPGEVLEYIQGAEVAFRHRVDAERYARAEVEVLRAAKDEACDGWERCRESYYRGNTDSLGYVFAVRRIAELRAIGKGDK